MVIFMTFLLLLRVISCTTTLFDDFPRCCWNVGVSFGFFLERDCALNETLKENGLKPTDSQNTIITFIEAIQCSRDATDAKIDEVSMMGSRRVQLSVRASSQKPWSHQRLVKCRPIKCRLGPDMRDERYTFRLKPLSQFVETLKGIREDLITWHFVHALVAFSADDDEQRNRFFQVLVG